MGFVRGKVGVQIPARVRIPFEFEYGYIIPICIWGSGNVKISRGK